MKLFGLNLRGCILVWNNTNTFMEYPRSASVAHKSKVSHRTSVDRCMFEFHKEASREGRVRSWALLAKASILGWRKEVSGFDADYCGFLGVRYSALTGLQGINEKQVNQAETLPTSENNNDAPSGAKHWVSASYSVLKYFSRPRFPHSTP